MKWNADTDTENIRQFPVFADRLLVESTSGNTEVLEAEQVMDLLLIFSLFRRTLK